MNSAGDVNNDGFDDFIIGAYGTDPNGSLSGKSYVVYGVDINAPTAGNDTITGTTGNDTTFG